LPAARVIGKSNQVDQQRWDQKYAGIEFEPALPPSQFVVAELSGQAGDRDRHRGHRSGAGW
jgi:hypothetical protein